ncbi:hypothetical protein [Marinicella litoralis]|uniref:hypothetical protein n=1 Tax=Marinicella litoralis TaxID=644220 RepID=UPI0013C31A06|nr:hypothetical protein [Marinicella litoralis]
MSKEYFAKKSLKMARTQQARTAYTFFHESGTRCLFNQPEPPFDLIFEDGFD